jgi:uncharacterized protein
MGNQRISLEPGVLKIGKTKEEDVLIGSKCKKCGRYFMPQRKWCGYCAEPCTEPIELSREGKLTSYSLMNRKPEYALIATPYVLGEVTIPEGIIIYSVINEKNVKNLKMGQRVRLDTVEIKKDDSGNSISAYAFKPCD